jgi:carboxypeptidase C (cathepsin A)
MSGSANMNRAWPVGAAPRRRWPAAAACLALLLGACGGGGGSGDPPTSGADLAVVQDSTVYGGGAGDALPSATETAAVTRHRVTLSSGAALDYTASVGHLNAGSPAPRASMFYVAYTADVAAAASAARPIVFFYNGGPGSASIWLHLGSWAPQRLVTDNPATTVPLPFTLVDNPLTLLGEADLVFVDAVGTGYSQAIAPDSNRSFWGVDADAAIFRDFVLRYTARNQRQNAPLVLYGESYGGLRTPLLAQALLAAGAPLQAIVLQSAILNYNSNCGVLDPGRLSCGSFIPSYGATAAWFQRARPQPTALATELPGFVQRVADYVLGSYEPAAQLYLNQRLALGAAMNQQLADYSGLSASDWQAAPLLGPDPYRRLLLPQQLLGRYDSRVNAALGSALASEGDPSNTVLTPAFRNAIADHLRQLKYQPAVPYLMFNEASINLWDWRHDGQALPDAIPDLALALALKPTLKVFVIGGYHDLATPFRQTELDLARLGSAPPGLTMRRYVGGHMTYLDDQVRPALAADLTALLRSLPATP